MSIKVINEVDTFSYRDSYTVEAKCNEEELCLYVEALIAKRNNSANTNYTDSYIKETKIEFENPKIVKLIKLGYKKYDANDNILETVEDKEEPFALVDINKLLQKVFLTGIEKASENNKYVISIEVPDEDPSAITDEYEIVCEADKVTISWDGYLNRVQDM